MFYLKLALNNIKNSKGIFAPFVLASLVLYLLNGATLLVYFSPVVKTMRHGQMALAISLAVLTLFSTIMSIYSFNFLLKQRSKEFGLYNMLGMKKSQIGLVASLELGGIYLAVISLGSLLSSGFANLFNLVFVRLIRGTDLSFSISPTGLVANAVIFAGIFLVLNLIGLTKVGKSSPLVLFRTQESGEKEPRGNILLAFLGLASLAGGYYLSLTSKGTGPLTTFYLFAIAVVLVIIGTYLFYMAFVAWFLKHRRADKAYFYQPDHFISTSQMIFRMKQHAAGLANITLLAVMAFVTIATTTALYTGMVNQTERVFPKNTQLEIYSDSEQEGRDIFQNQVLSQLPADKEIIDYQSVLFPIDLGKDKDLVLTEEGLTDDRPRQFFYLYVVSLEDFRKFGNEVPNLAPGSAYFYQPNGGQDLASLDILGNKLTVADNLKRADFPDLIRTVSSVLMVVENAQVRDQLYQDYMAMDNPPTPNHSTYTVLIDLTEGEQETIFSDSLDVLSPTGEVIGNGITKDVFESLAIGFTGGFLFTGFLLGTAFLLSAALIIYYKQYSEGHEDKRSYRILQEVGLSAAAVKKTIQSQVLTVFFMPLVMAVLHFLVALVALKQMLTAFGITSSSLIYTVSGLVILGVTVTYFLIYKVTSRVYYKIVER